MSQRLVKPYSQEEIDTLTQEDIDRGCLKYRLEVNEKILVLEDYGVKTDWSFNITGGEPSMPIKIYYEIDHKGWDIPTLYAIDADNRCWMNDAHGGYVEECTYEALINITKDESLLNDIRAAVGKPVRKPCQCCNGTGWVD
jgi:hypothetical protein